MKPFEHWKYQELEITFGLRRVKKMPLLEQWLAASVMPTSFEEQSILFLQSLLRERADSWNEDELKFNFIGPLVTLVNYQGEFYSLFNQRYFHSKIRDIKGNEVELKGRIEAIVARGTQDPLEPYFFLHEYKQEKRRDNDPLGQLLSAMLVAQNENAHPKPLFGCYVVGRMWFFVLLDGKNYGTSLAFDATQQDVFNIFSILRHAKFEIEKQVHGLLD